jgi:hypothetical protein
MLYIATPSGPEIRAAMAAGILACMVTPAQGNVVPAGARWAADNGKFGKGWPGADAWLTWLTAAVERYGAARCLWAAAPDVPFDAAATLAESRPWLPRVRALGVPAAFVAQDGCDELLPWGEFDVLFLGGSTEWKVGPAAERVSREATRRGVPVHMGRVNSWRRLRIAEWFGCATVDGTFLAFGPDKNLGQLVRWVGEVRSQPSFVGEWPT